MLKFSKFVKIIGITMCLVMFGISNSVNMVEAKSNEQVKYAQEYNAEEPIVKVAGTMGELTGAAKDFLNKGDSSGFTADKFADDLLGIGQILAAIGVATLVIVITYMGIKWLVAEPNDKAKLKKQLIGLVVSAIVIFGAVIIWQVAQDIGAKLEQI